MTITTKTPEVGGPMIDEGLQHILEFCKNDDRDIEGADLALRVMKTRLHAINESDGITSYVLGGMLKRLKEKDFWKNLPDVKPWWKWADFCKVTTGKSVGACYAKIRIWEKSQKVGMTPEEVEEVGWGVADRILSESASRADVDRLLAVHKDSSSRDEFLDKMQAEEDDKPPGKKKVRRRVVKLKKEQEEFFDQTLEVAAERAGRELYKNMSQEEALIFALAEWREGLGGK